MMRAWWILLVLLAPLAQAASVHAFLDRTHVSLGDTVTLNIRSDAAIGMPNLAPLQQDFQVLGSSRSSSTALVNGRVTRTAKLGIALRPRRAGALPIPPLDVGGATTQAMTVQVGAAPSGGSGHVGDPAFMEANVLSSGPYVGQETTYTVRLFYLPGVDGALGDPSADGARLVQLDRDRHYVADRDGYAYKVLERSWALIPQRGGSIVVNGPVFHGQQLTTGSPGNLFNNPNALLNGQFPSLGAPVQATAPAVHITARAMPPGAGKPWLPARDVQLQLTGLPANGEVNAGTPLTLTLSIRARGQPADVLPEPELPPIAAAAVYPDQTRDATDASGEWLAGSRTRSFAIVPQRNGTLVIPAITLDWWNVVQDRQEQAIVPAHTLQVSGVVATSARAPVAASTAAATRATNPSASVEPTASARGAAYWRAVALASVALWLLVVGVALAWWYRRRRTRRMALQGFAVGDGPHATMAGAPAPLQGKAALAAKPDLRVLHQRALDAAHAGDVADCDNALLAWARAVRPGIANASALCAALSDPAQRGALAALQRARWQGTGAATACAAVAEAFVHHLVWAGPRCVERDKQSALPPLYPPR